MEDVGERLAPLTPCSFTEVKFMSMRFRSLALAIAAAIAMVNIAGAVEVPDPLIWLKMDGNYNNSGTGGQTATLQTGTSNLDVTYVTGRDGTAGGAVRLNTVDTGDTIADGAGNNLAISYTLPNTGTIAMWYYVKDTVGANNSSYYQEMFCSNAGGDKWEGWTSRYFKNMGARINDNVWNSSATVFPVLTTGWHHLAFTWNHEEGSSTVSRSVYIDGALGANGSTTGASTENWTAPGSILAIGGNYGNTCGNGYYDDVRIYTSALTAGQVGSIVPEPGTFAMVIAGLIGALAYAWRKRK
jgi:hypothetical protein